MAELKRTDKELTTANLAGKNDGLREPETRPQVVDNEQRMPPASVFPSTTQGPTQTADSRFSDDSLATLRRRDMAGRATGSPSEPAAAGEVGLQPAGLFVESEVGDFRTRWSGIQTAFVDEPRRAVGDADSLVASVMKKLAESFANERARLEKQWDRGDKVSTEDLRIALQRYRAFFDRLLRV